MTPEEADAFEAQHRYGPSARAAHARYQKRWAAWCHGRGQDPATAGPDIVATWIGSLRREGGTMYSADSLRQIVAALDEMPDRTGPPCARHPLVDAQYKAVEKQHQAGPARTVFTADVARLVLALPPPPEPPGVTDARLVLLTAVNDNTGCRAALRCLPGSDRRTDAQRRLTACLGGPGTSRYDHPRGMTRAELTASTLRLDLVAARHTLTLAGVSLAWYCAFHGSELGRARRSDVKHGAAGFSVRRDNASPGRVLLAKETPLCAATHLRTWLRTAGPARPEAPLFPNIEVWGTSATGVNNDFWTRHLDVLGTRAGTPGLTVASLRDGYAVAAHQQGASIASIAAGLGVTSLGYAEQYLQGLLERTTA